VVIAPGSGPDRTAAYQELRREGRAALISALSTRLADKQFVLVRGFLTDLLDRADVMMADQRRAVEALQCRVYKPRFDSEQPPSVNAVAIAETVRSIPWRTGRDVILITHSKGSVDTLTALVEHPAMGDRIAGWISIQGAVHGSPVADRLAGPAGLEVSLLSMTVQHIFRGSVEALRALQTGERERYLVENTAQIANIVRRIPTLAYGSAARMARSTLRKVTTRFFRDGFNDGLVSMQHTVIPGAAIVQEVDGPDHGDAVTAVPLQPFDRIGMTYALLSVLPMN
jgi:triacylglycerol esterase/lipase EstA (alpha/beta hydrolase family)